MERWRAGRRATLAALAAWALACAWPASGQDPHMTEAQAAALSWLKIADKDDAKGTYDASAQRFHAAMTQEQWAQALAHARNQFGPVKRRTLLGARPPAPAKDVPPGDFAVIVYRTEFEKRPTGTETLTLERESDGKWRVVGYLMR